MIDHAVDDNTLAVFEQFQRNLDRGDLLNDLRQGLIGEGVMVDGAFGPKPLVYADYVASGRALRQVEDFVMSQVLPFYANSHTEASYVGGKMTRMRAAARAVIARLTGADAGYATIFGGSGATAGINRLVHLLGVSGEAARGGKPLVLIGPYEHHSNILPWRESGAEVIEIGEAASGGPDLAELEAHLAGAARGRLVVGAFSLMSNVTGIITDADAVTRLLNRYGAKSVWDCAGSGPYQPIEMKAGTDAQKDAVIVSPHKFIGGPGASGILIVRKAAVERETPVQPGGGTVRFVSPWGHDYTDSLCAREEAGTPNVIGDIRAALCFLVKDVIGQPEMDRRHTELRTRALDRWRGNPSIEILGNPAAPVTVPVFSLRLRDPRTGGYIHQQLVTRMLSDLYGIQARGGCACAGPYAHRLLGLDRGMSSQLRTAILSGEETQKPGWTRLNLSVLLTDEKAGHIIQAVDELAANPYPMCEWYACDHATARFKPLGQAA
ncbi:aminotransferase class V [Roseibium aquae]|uniref:Aminotransferase class V n=1 Tax=Roseibium aquae TaxID=1323746 RepID=A0A916TLL8_9HYPH|nr:aminotransferase class V-fold PLP-dependent enzyme [Roseibium aquae]GGB56175.1 aminotransferase class V [Roseibium aquae]